MAQSSDICSPTGIQVSIQELQVRFLIESLSAMRVADKADVVMVCGDKEFYAHKLILEASSPYFTTMFQSNFKEAISGKIVFTDKEPEILEAILDFLYSGDVKKIQTEDQLIKVLEASDMMALQNLFQYCCNSLLKMLAPVNFVAIWVLAERYEEERMLAEVKSYFLKYSTEILSSKEFLTVNIKQLKDLVLFFKSKFRNIDGVLRGVVLWVLHDLSSRERYTGELFDFFEANRVSMQCAKSLLNESELMTIAKELATRLKELLIEICLAEQKEISTGVANSETPEMMICGHKLLFLMQQSTTKIVDKDGKSEVQAESFASYFQLFDLKTMSWQQAKPLPFVNFKVEAMCQYKDCIFWGSSTAGNLYVLYDISKNTFQCVATSNNYCAPNDTACYFKDKIYLIGGTRSEDSKTSVPVWLTIRSGYWEKKTPLKHRYDKPVLFSSDSHLYVTGGISSLSKQIVEYTNGYEGVCGRSQYLLTWTTAELPNNLISADVHFFLLNNVQLCGLYNFHDNMLKLTYNNPTWDVQVFPKEILHKERKIGSIFSTQKDPFVYISTTDSKLDIPNYVLELNSLEWSKLPTPKGDCEISKCGNMLKANFYLP